MVSFILIMSFSDAVGEDVRMYVYMISCFRPLILIVVFVALGSASSDNINTSMHFQWP